MSLSSWQLQDRQVTVSQKPSAVTVSFTPQEMASYDLDGRLLGMYREGINVRRSLSNTYQKRWRLEGQKGDIRHQKRLTVVEAREIVEKYRSLVELLLNDEHCATTYPETAAVFRRIAGYTFEALENSATEFQAIYGHIPILPPDQYRALVLQATDGCTYNQCTFCTLYRDKAFTVRGSDEFRQHIDRVVNFLGAGISYRNSVFLGDANALAISQERLTELLEILWSHDTVKPYLEQGGLHAFLDIYTGAHKSTADYQELVELGLRRISLGVESGCEALLEFVQKPGTREEIIQVITDMKAAGLAVVVILMVGLGGERYRRAHLHETVSLVRSLPLGQRDIVYLSQFEPTATAPYLSIAETEKIEPLPPADMRDEVHNWKTLLDRELGGRGVKIAPYSFQRFIY